MGYSLAVDLGTTFTAAAVNSAGRIEMVTLGERTVVVPSLVFVREDGVVLTGDAAARRAATNPNRIGREFKRRLGDPTPLMLGGTPHSAAALLGYLLRDVKQRVTETAGEEPDEVVLTRPANWGPYRRELFDEVPRLAGLDGVFTVTEPEAAAAYYGARRHLAEGDVVAVYDLGGGTFDATVLRRVARGIEILGDPEGIEHLGGVDFDDAVMAYVDSELGGALGQLAPSDPRAAAALRRLRQDCVEAKETLSVDTETTIPVFLPNRHAEVHLDRGTFEDMIRGPVESTVEALRRALRSAHVAAGDLATVVLVGGSSRIPLVARMISAELGRPIAVDAHPKYAVALGAATLATTHAHTRKPVIATDEPEGALVELATSRGQALGGGTAQAEAVPAPGEQEPAEPRAVTAASPPVIQEERPPPGETAPLPARGPRQRPRRRTVSLVAACAFAVVVGLLFAFGVFRVGSRGGQAPPPAAENPAVVAPPRGAGALPPKPHESLDSPVVSATIGVAGPEGLAVTPDGGRAYVTSGGASRLSVIDTATGKVTDSIYWPQPPRYVAVAPNGTRLYISCFETNGPKNVVSAVDPATNAITASIPVGEHPYALAVDPSGRQVYVPDHNSGSIAVIDTASNAVAATIPVKPNPHSVAFTPDGRTAYVADHESNLISVIDTTSRAVVATVSVPKSPHSAVVAPDGRHVLVASYDANSASVIDTATNTVTATIQVGANPRNVAYAPDGRHAYVANSGSNSVSVIDTDANRVTATVPVGTNPVWVSVTPDGRRAYVADTDSNSVTVLSTAE